MTSKNKGHILLSLVDGRTIRDLLYNGFIDLLQQEGIRITIASEAARVPAFIDEWNQFGVGFIRLFPVVPSIKRKWARKFRQRVVQLDGTGVLDAWLKLEQRWLYPPAKDHLRLLEEDRPNLVVATHTQLYDEMPLVLLARRMAIPTLGLVRSWDNVHKGLGTRPEYVAVWNEINRREVVEMEGYSPDRVVVTGAPQFDPYFSPDAILSRDEFAACMALDPRRSILLLATTGAFRPNYDETYLMDFLLEQIGCGAIHRHPQIICRLHPWSHLETFWKYKAHSDVRLSHYTRHIPTLGWTMNRDDVVLVANILKHADVVITPASTMTLEAAVFDTPTLVPLFHMYQPELAQAMFSRSLSWHFGRLERQDLVPIIREPEELVSAINRCLQEPDWYRDQRAQLVRDYIQFTDGRSTERLIELILQIAQEEYGNHA